MVASLPLAAHGQHRPEVAECALRRGEELPLGVLLHREVLVRLLLDLLLH